MKHAIKSSWPSQTMADLRIEQGALGFVEPEENFALGEDGGLGRIHILRRFFVTGQNASAEADHPAPARRRWET